MENMKYIRTKDNVFVKGVIGKQFIVKEADTIEELCDGLIVEDKDNTDNWFVMDISEYQSKDNEDKKYMVDRWNFYAFIKTDKGLIYVAKMNEEGKLCLL